MLFADDNILFSCKTTNNVDNVVNMELNSIHKWLCTNKFPINLSKTNFMVFNKRKGLFIPKIVIDNQAELAYCVRFLGYR